MTNVSVTCPPSSPTSRRSPTGCCQGERARYDKRVASSMDELQDVLRRCVPAARAACASTSSPYGPDDRPDEGHQPPLAVCSLVTVSFPVEVWRQPRVPDSGRRQFDAVLEPAI